MGMSRDGNGGLRDGALVELDMVHMGMGQIADEEVHGIGRWHCDVTTTE